MRERKEIQKVLRDIDFGRENLVSEIWELF